MEKKNNGVIITLMGIIIVILMVLCILFATDTIKFNHKVDNNSKKDIIDKKEEKDLNKEDTMSQKYLEEKYKPVLEEIKAILDGEEYQSDKFKYVSEVLQYYMENKESYGLGNLEYTYYDINHDGIKELIIENTYIYTLKNDTPVNLISSPTIDGRYSFKLYENGTILERRGTSSSTGYYIFSKIENETKQLNSSYYTYEFDEENNMKIYKANSNMENLSLTEYQSDEELINKYVNNTKELNLEFDKQV